MRPCAAALRSTGPLDRTPNRRAQAVTPKADIDTERQLVHKRAHAIVFIVSICCLLMRGGSYFAPFFSSRPGKL